MGLKEAGGDAPGTSQGRPPRGWALLTSLCEPQFPTLPKERVRGHWATCPGLVSCGSAPTHAVCYVFPRRSQPLLMPGAPRQPRVREAWTTARCHWWKRAWVSMGPELIPRFSCSSLPAEGCREVGLPPGGWPPLFAPPTPRAFTLAPSWGRLCQGADVGDRVPRVAEARPGPPPPPAASHPHAHALQTVRSQAAGT